MDPASETPSSVAFGRFRVLPHRRELLADGRPVKLGGRAFDVLMALIEARGTVLGKDALMGARVAQSGRRGEKAARPEFSVAHRLGAERELIRTVPGRGISSPERSWHTSTSVRTLLRQSLDRPCRRRTCQSRRRN